MPRTNLRARVDDGRDAGAIAPGDIRRAVQRSELILEYQPLVSLRQGNVVGMEALVRWDHPRRGRIGPDAFIPVAEEGPEIEHLGRWVIRSACAQAARWQRLASADSEFSVSVNVSARQLTAALVGVVTDALGATTCRPRSLVIELTETSAMADPEGTRCILGELDDLGVRTVVDDFGTGYSSLAYLRRLPLHAIKVDRSFIDGVGREPEDTAIVAAVVSMAHALGRSVVAEGVETATQLEHLRTLGCDMAQGFYFGYPLPPDQASEVLAQAACGSWRPLGWNSSDGSWAPTPSVPVVLVVDDSDDIRFLVRAALTAAGFCVLEASSGRDALKLVAAKRPDCVVLDMEMPGMSGLEVISQVRSAGNAGVAMLMLTGCAAPATRARAYAVGADDFIVKPIAPRELIERVARALRDRGARGRQRPSAAVRDS